jgi:hypothetical protein
VDERRVEDLKEAAHAALELAFSTGDAVEALRMRMEVAWRSEQDIERLRARALRVCQETPALAQRMESVRTTQVTSELQEVGLEAVRTAGKDTLCSMAVQTAALDGVDVNTRLEAAAGEERWLWLAAKEGLVETVRALLRSGAEVNHADSNGSTALFAAAFNGQVEAVEALAQAGALVDHADNGGWTPLWGASLKGHVETIQALVAAGADPNRAASNGCTPMVIARANGHEAAALALVQGGATQ